MNDLDKFLWISITAGHVAIVLTLFRTRLSSVYRWFTILLVQDLIQTVVLYSVRSLHVYRYNVAAHSIGELLDLALQFLAASELIQSKKWKGKTIAITLSTYIACELIVLFLVAVHGPYHHYWRIAARTIQPLYLACESLWLLLLWSIHADVQRTMKGDTYGN